MPTYKLYYFDIERMGEPIRQIFAYAGQEFEDCRIKHNEWPAFKSKTPFGKLPLLEVDGKILNQSNAMARYLGKKFGLVSSDEWEDAQAEALVDTIDDLKPFFYKYVLELDAKLKAEAERNLLDEHLPFFFRRFEKVVASNPSGWLVGSHVSWADFIFAGTLSTYEEIFPGILKEYPALCCLKEKVHNIPNVKNYLDKRRAGKLISTS